MEDSAQPTEVMDLLRFATIGSVDDGKSTLIGRLLIDTRQLFNDQVEAIATASRNRGVGDLDLSFVTDGLRAEREQGITIDVAYRYAATPTRKFVIADCPGHVQYTANMATGASNADVALVVVDATVGLKEQTKRHLCIASLLGVREFIVCANKMDITQWSEEAYKRIIDQMHALPSLFASDSITVIPISALLGDNVVDASDAAPYYNGPTVLEALESAPAGALADQHGEGSESATRLPVQWILRQPGEGRRYAGMINGAPLRVGDNVVVLPEGLKSTVLEIKTPSGLVDEASVELSVSVALADDLDVSRGDMIVGAQDLPTVSQTIDATVCWFSATPLHEGDRIRIKHTTRSSPALVAAIHATFESENFSLQPNSVLENNDIGTVTLNVATPLVFDDYQQNHITGSFVLIHEATNVTVGAGMIQLP